MHTRCLDAPCAAEARPIAVAVLGAPARKMSSPPLLRRSRVRWGALTQSCCHRSFMALELFDRWLCLSMVTLRSPRCCSSVQCRAMQWSNFLVAALTLMLCSGCSRRCVTDRWSCSLSLRALLLARRVSFHHLLRVVCFCSRPPTRYQLLPHHRSTAVRRASRDLPPLNQQDRTQRRSLPSQLERLRSPHFHHPLVRPVF